MDFNYEKGWRAERQKEEKSGGGGGGEGAGRAQLWNVWRVGTRSWRRSRTISKQHPHTALQPPFILKCNSKSPDKEMQTDTHSLVWTRAPSIETPVLFVCFSGIALCERVLPARLGLMSTLCSCLCCSGRLKGTAIKLELTNLLKECWDALKKKTP